MGRNELQKVSLSTLGHGIAAEVVDREIDEVLRNIKDPNTVAKAKRKIVVEIVITPDESREAARVTLSCSSKLGKVKPYEATVHFVQKDGQLGAYQRAAEPTGNVVPMAQNDSI